MMKGILILDGQNLICCRRITVVRVRDDLLNSYGRNNICNSVTYESWMKVFGCLAHGRQIATEISKFFYQFREISKLTNYFLDGCIFIWDWFQFHTSIQFRIWRFMWKVVYLLVTASWVPSTESRIPSALHPLLIYKY